MLLFVNYGPYYLHSYTQICFGGCAVVFSADLHRSRDAGVRTLEGPFCKVARSPHSYLLFRPLPLVWSLPGDFSGVPTLVLFCLRIQSTLSRIPTKTPLQRSTSTGDICREQASSIPNRLLDVFAGFHRSRDSGVLTLAGLFCKVAGIRELQFPTSYSGCSRRCGV